MKTKVFIDSSFWIAFVDRSDSNHQKAKRFTKEKLGQYLLFTSDYVLDECLTRIKKKTNPKDAFLFYRLIKEKEKEGLLILFQTPREVFNTAYKIFKNNPTPKTFSFTDATVVALMKARKIKNLLTFDQDFKKIKPKIKVLP